MVPYKYNVLNCSFCFRNLVLLIEKENRIRKNFTAEKTNWCFVICCGNSPLNWKFIIKYLYLREQRGRFTKICLIPLVNNALRMVCRIASWNSKFSTEYETNLKGQFQSTPENINAVHDMSLWGRWIELKQICKYAEYFKKRAQQIVQINLNLRNIFAVRFQSVPIKEMPDF